MSTRDSALAWPPGEVSEIDRIASQLALVATTVDQTVVAREGGQGWGLARSWSGPAFEAARSEAAVGDHLADFVVLLATLGVTDDLIRSGNVLKPVFGG